MSYFNLVDEAVIDAKVSRVFQSILDANNWHKWWRPYIEAKIQGDEKLIQVNSIIEIRIHYIVTVKFYARVRDIVRNREIKVEYFKGDLLGTGEWRFESINSKARILYRFQAKPNRTLIRLLLRFIDFPKVHSDIMRSGFRGLNRYLAGSPV